MFLLILTPLLLVSVVLGAWRFVAAQRTSEELFDRGLLSAALAISRDVGISEGDALSPRTRQLISDAGGGEVFYHVTGPGGIYVTGYAYPPRPSAQVTPQDPLYFVATYRGDEVRVMRMSETTTIDNLTGMTVVTVWQRVSDRNAFAAQLARRTLIVMAALMATLAVVVWFGVLRGLRPLRGLQDAIARRSPDDLSRIQRPVPTEVSGIVSTLNRLFGQMENSIQAHQAFISDAAHQLRNPAAAVLALAETLPLARKAGTGAEREEDLIDAARQLSRLTDQLLSLERLHYNGLQNPRRVDLAEIAKQASRAAAPQVLLQDLQFEFDAPEGELPVFGDEVLLREALTNLIDNALCHGGPDMTTIWVRVAQVADQAELSVSDDGRGLPQDKIDVAFRRFGQLETGAGSGLGLTIVDEVVKNHAGEIAVVPVTKGTTIRIRIPLFDGTADTPDAASTTPRD
ncbi:sensor histidine kinase [Aliishimia ponticola]|uniref:sensor histidine kinase n=1 Tax=Aliishimia ponticola TaxID=2499833 RepID=UPI001FE406B7|nr:sensor histidine kinase [Aliishimia ponticola]